ncbi:hypothetical protein [Burkholderia phage BCSR5]|nr:hypothetical protein [Burkholderia phage BCSR5]
MPKSAKRHKFETAKQVKKFLKGKWLDLHLIRSVDGLHEVQLRSEVQVVVPPKRELLAPKAKKKPSKTQSPQSKSLTSLLKRK